MPLSECVPRCKRVPSSRPALLSAPALLSQLEQLFLPVFVLVHYLLAPFPHNRSGEVWAGCPAVFQRKCTVGEIDTVNAARAATIKLAALHADENSKSFAEVEQERLQRQLLEERDSDYDSSLGKSCDAFVCFAVDLTRASGLVGSQKFDPKQAAKFYSNN